MEILANPVIAEYGTWFIAMAFLFGLYLTWGIGANDVSNAIGTSVGSGALTVKQAIVIAGVFEFAGAVLAGGSVTTTIRSGILDPDALSGTPELLIIGMLAALLASGIWIMLATHRGWPVSTTHAIVGALVGFGAAGIGSHAVQWDGLTEITLSWLASPLISAMFGFILMRSVQWLVFETSDPLASAKKWGPYYVFLAGYAVALVTLSQGLDNFDLNLSLAQSQIGAVATGLLCAIIGMLMIRRVKSDQMANRSFHFASVERVFTPLMVFTACAMAFAHGSNDVANGIGPIAAIITMVKTSSIASSETPVPAWLLLAGGGAILVGISTYGYKVIQTIGTRITELTSSRGYCATLASAITVISASGLGLPVSTTHIAVGGVIGVGMARGISALDLRVLGSILVSWFITLPVTASLSAILYFLMKLIFVG